MEAGRQLGFSMNRITALFQFARRVWVALGLGWAAFIIGGLTLGLDRSGALLVCGAIVAEVFNDKRHRLFSNQIQPGVKTWSRYAEVGVPGEDRKDIKVTPHATSSGSTVVNTDHWSLYHLATEQEFYPQEDTRMWDLERTMKRVENKVDYAIVVSVIAGTLVWAFCYTG